MLFVAVLVGEVTHSNTRDVITLSSLAGDWTISPYQLPTTHHTSAIFQIPKQFSQIPLHTHLLNSLRAV
jgi:hypothetical protein